MSTTYINPFTGGLVTATIVSYASLNLTQNTQLVWPTYAPTTTVNTFPVARNLDVNVNPNISPVPNLALPQGNFGSLGDDITITNQGSLPLVITNTAGQTVATIATGVSVWFYLTDNTTTTGSWGSKTLGAGTTGTAAYDLAGNGLIANAGKLAIGYSVVSFNQSGYPLTETSRAQSLVWTGGLGSLSLPIGSSVSTGFFFAIRNQGTGTLTLTPAQVGAKINGQNSQDLAVGVSTYIVLDSTSGNYWAFGGTGAQNFSFSSATYDVDSIVGNTLNLSSSAPIIERFVANSGARTQTLLVTLPAIASVYSFINATANTTYSITFQLNGTAQTPISVAANTQAFVVSDGLALYLVNSTAIASLQLNDGSATAPTLNFLNETNTGLYRAGGLQLGLTVGGNSIATFNGSNPATPLIRTPATLVALRIDGGLI